ncbi:hypothetical protein I316_03286 [Kwoniella heveanensis BCC8398]|uniref:Velvet domain-containing protein n=1 Tax=Kwoniella heveanensis BCC8398 TaxID=1296120 RepID=A0A1B9GW39_9TREE|nr:hypothetical protein I316_03286 [Kwoniella heveanensis BCC8398]
MLKRAAVARPLYELKVRQQPERARLCSYKEENETIDRRPVDPPPVVELRSHEIPSDIVSATAVPVPVPDHGLPSVSEPYYSAIKTPIGADATTGEVVQTPEKLKLLDGRPAALCIFAKLSVRVPGVFRLMFTLFETTDAGIVELARTVSDPFEVFSPKLFKGMHESTPLTRHLAAQGLKVKLRTDTSVGRQSTSRRRTPAATTPIHVAFEKTSDKTSTATFPMTATSASVVKIQPARTANNSTRHSPVDTRSISVQPRKVMATSNRSLIWKTPMEPFGYANEQAIAGPGPTTAGKRRFMDDGMIPSLVELSNRFDWTPTPPATDLAAFSLSRNGSPGQLPQHGSGPAGGPGSAPVRSTSPHRPGPSPVLDESGGPYLGGRTSASASASASSSQSSFTRSSASASTEHIASPFSTTNHTRRSSSYTQPSSVSSTLPSPFPRLNLGPGDDGIPILPLPSMYASSSSRPPPFVPPSVHQVLEPQSHSPSRPHSHSHSPSTPSLPNTVYHHQSITYNSPDIAVPSPRLPLAGRAPPFDPGSEMGHGIPPMVSQQLEDRYMPSVGRGYPHLPPGYVDPPGAHSAVVARPLSTLPPIRPLTDEPLRDYGRDGP